MHPYLKTAQKRVVIGDGAFGTHIQGLDLTEDDFGGAHLEGCNEILCLRRPDLISAMHEGFLAIGSDFITTATFGAVEAPLAEYGIQDQAKEINTAGARIAREAADQYSTPENPRWVAGSMGPGTTAPSLGQDSYDQLKDAYWIQAVGLI